jgi:hypothetical protein
VRVGADGGRKFEVMDVFWESEMLSDGRRLLLKTKPFAVCPFPTIGFSGAGINAFQAHMSSIFVHPSASTHAHAGREDRGFFKRLHHRWQESCHSLGDARKRAGFGSQKRVRSGHAER